MDFRIDADGVMLAGEGLHPSSKGKRVVFSGSTKTVVDGPFAETKELVAGFWLWQVKNIEEAIEWAEALNVLRLQLERMQAGFIPSLREYNRVFGVTRERLERAPRELLILHPGPMNRGVEIDSDVADGPHSVILDQVTNGVAVRMAVLYLLSGGRPELAEAAKGER